MINYEPLYENLLSRRMTMKDLSIAIGLAPTTLATMMSKGENISTDTLNKICTYLNCGIEDVVAAGPVEKKKRTKIIPESRAIAQGYVTVNWKVIDKAITEKGESPRAISLAIGKPSNFIAKKHSALHLSKDNLKLLTDYLGLKLEDCIL